jgi:serine phosphatase RsbU (regulator of sigma subunit)
MRGGPVLGIGLATLLLGLGARSALSQEPAPAELSAQPLLTSRETVEFSLPWRFQPGDDPAWAAPGYDDTSWGVLSPSAPERRDAPDELAHGVVWFRRHLRVAPGLLGASLALRAASPGRVTLYVDGVDLGSFEPPRASPEKGAAVQRGPTFFTLASGREHLLAVRYDGRGRGPESDAASPRFFLLSLAGPEAVLGERALAARLDEALAVAATALPVFLVFLHLALYWYYRKALENLFYACCMASFAIIVFAGSAAPRLLSEQAAGEVSRFTAIGIFGAALFGLLTYYARRTRPIPKSWIPFSGAALLLVAAYSVFPGPFWNWGWYLYFAATMLEIVRIERSGHTVETDGAGLLLWGLIVLGAFVTLQALINVGAVAPLGGYRDVYVLGMLAFAVSMSLFLARKIAYTSVHLETRLEEVQQLSSQVLAQERSAHERELQQRLLVAENERKGHELEEARELQLSMLPATLPRVEGLDVAVAMTTATEVGGDYYDFQADESSLVLAVGDATGHGAAAGTMVTVVKALFSSLGAAKDLAALMSEYDRVLRSLSLKRMHMCLMVARITPRRVTICSAAMPPVMLRRTSSGAVEELGEGGLPLGGNLSPSYSEHVAQLGPGDTLLFASDGLTELLDPSGRAFGYDRAAAVLREAGDEPASQSVQRLNEALTAWRGERAQVDDVTLVVVRVSR